MRKPTLYAMLAAFLIGYVAHMGVARIMTFVNRHQIDVTYHWKRVDAYNAYLRNPGNYTVTNGLSGATIPYDIEPHLAYLVSANELYHVDLILPTVPYGDKANRHWMQYVERHRETIIHASGSVPNGGPFRIAGAAPLHLSIWYRPGAEKTVQQLIDELESLATQEPKAEQAEQQAP